MIRLRELPDETGGFTHSSRGASARAHQLQGVEATGVEDLRTLADRAGSCGQRRQPPGIVGHAGRQGGAAQPVVRLNEHGQRHDRGKRRPGSRPRVLMDAKSRSCATSRMPATCRNGATCTMRSLGEPRVPGAETSLGCSRWPPPARRGHLGASELINYPARSRAEREPPEWTGCREPPRPPE